MIQRPSGAFSELQKHVQLELTDRSKLTEGHSYGVYSQNAWWLCPRALDVLKRQLAVRARLELAGEINHDQLFFKIR